MDADEARDALTTIAHRRRDAQRLRAEIAAELSDAIRAAHTAGLTVTEIASLADVSRRAVYDALPRRRD